MTPRYRYLGIRLAIVGVVLLATLTNLQFSLDMTAVPWRLHRAFLPELHWGDAIDGLRNLALFAGLGVVWVVTSLTGRLRRDVQQATLVGCALSVMVEGLQLFSSVRNASIVDVTTNTLGALLGASAIALLLVTLRREQQVKSYVGLPMLFIAGPYLLALACEALTPLFHSEPIEGLRGSPLARWHQSMAHALPLTFAEVPVSDIPLFAAGGFALVMLLREHTWHSARSVIGALLVGTVVISSAQLVHGAYGLEIRWEAIVTDVLSLALGAWMALAWLAPITQRLRGAARARATLAAQAVLLLLWGWRPYHLELNAASLAGELSLDHWVPLRALAVRADVFSAIHVAQQFLLYVPLGALLAVWPLKRRGLLSSLWPAIALALFVEAGHIVIAERLFDITNALLAIAGLEIGWIVVRRCGYTPYGEAL